MLTFSIVSSLIPIHISDVNLVFNKISIIFTNQNNEVLFVSKRPKPHNKLPEIKWIKIWEDDGHLKSINKSRYLIKNKILRNELFKTAGIVIAKPNSNLPTVERPSTSNIPSRRPQPVQIQTQYRPVITRNAKWSEEDLAKFMKQRFPE